MVVLMKRRGKMWKHLIILLTSFFLSYSSTAFSQAISFYYPYHVWNFGEVCSSSIKDSSRIQKLSAIKGREFTDFTLDTYYSNPRISSLKETQKIPGKIKSDYYKKRIIELDGELQVQMKNLINEIYKNAQKLNIEMPPHPDPPYTDEQIEYFINYYEQEFGGKVIDTIEYVENEKKRRKKGEKKNSKEVMNIVFDLTDKIYFSVESDDPIQFLKNLEEDFYYKRSLEYLKEINYDHYRFVLKEYIHVLRLMEKKRPVITLKNTENDFEILCNKFCSNNK